MVMSVRSRTFEQLCQFYVSFRRDGHLLCHAEAAVALDTAGISRA